MGIKNFASGIGVTIGGCLFSLASACVCGVCVGILCGFAYLGFKWLIGLF